MINFKHLKSIAGVILIMVTIFYLLCAGSFFYAITKAALPVFVYVMAVIVFGLGGWLIWKQGWGKLRE